MKTHVFCGVAILAFAIASLSLTVELQHERQVNAMLRDRHPVGFTNDVLTKDETQYCAAREKVADVGIVKFKNGDECSWGIGWTKGQVLSNAVKDTGSVTTTGNCAVANTGSISGVSITCGTNDGAIIQDNGK
jgi:hypothetical protein